MKRTLLGLVAMLCAYSEGMGNEPPPIPNTKNVIQEDVVAHDPVIIREGATYYLFTTGPGVSVWQSQDMERWTMMDPVFPKAPDWAKERVPEFNGHMWAPDISYHKGRYYLYYSVSSFGKNNSCIGLATNETLDPTNEKFQWIDEGVVVESEPGMDDWNAIDPNLIFDQNGEAYLAYGSFWSGLKLSLLTEDLTRLADPEAEPIAIASRVELAHRNVEGEVSLEAGNGAIEGPFIYPKNGYYYLFASVDYCCRGVNSTYKMIYGRSRDLAGPYLDKNGLDMKQGGGTLFKRGDERWHGVGHNAICPIDGTEYAVFHGYDGQTKRGLPKLHVQEVRWDDDGWPYLVEDEK